MDTKECWLATPKIHFKAISIYTTFGSGQSLTWSSCCFFPLPKNEKKQRYFHNSFIYAAAALIWPSECGIINFSALASLYKTQRNKISCLWSLDSKNDRDDTIEWPLAEFSQTLMLFLLLVCWQQHRLHSFIHISSLTFHKWYTFVGCLVHIFMFKPNRKTEGKKSTSD